MNGPVIQRKDQNYEYIKILNSILIIGDPKYQITPQIRFY